MEIGSSNIRSAAYSSYDFKQEQSVSIQKPSVPSPTDEADSIVEGSDEISLDARTRKLIQALEVLTGEKIDIRALLGKSSQNSSSRSNSPIITYENMQSEQSGLDVSFDGKIQTKDGKEIAFSLSIKWDQKFLEMQRIRMQDGKVMQDPLIISLDGTPPVSSEKIDFNLNSSAKQINKLNSNAGYLVNDRNSNQKADDGSELFGPQTSNGFKELALYDDDKNGWIDSADKVFKQLYIWNAQQNSDGMVSLEQAGIGAISLSTVDVNYTQKSSIDDSIANFKEASVAVGEDGQSYGVFSVDLSA
jgi:hypothetical protein